MRRGLALLLASIALTSCSLAPAIATETQAPASVSSLDGEWEGVGSTVDGKQFSINFVIQNGSLAGILYSFGGTNGRPCQAITYEQISASQRSSIKDDLAIVAAVVDVTESSVLVPAHSSTADINQSRNPTPPTSPKGEALCTIF